MRRKISPMQYNQAMTADGPKESGGLLSVDTGDSDGFTYTPGMSGSTLSAVNEPDSPKLKFNFKGLLGSGGGMGGLPGMGGGMGGGMDGGLGGLPGGMGGLGSMPGGRRQNGQQGRKQELNQAVPGMGMSGDWRGFGGTEGDGSASGDGWGFLPPGQGPDESEGYTSPYPPGGDHDGNWDNRDEDTGYYPYPGNIDFGDGDFPNNPGAGLPIAGFDESDLIGGGEGLAKGVLQYYLATEQAKDLARNEGEPSRRSRTLGQVGRVLNYTPTYSQASTTGKAVSSAMQEYARAQAAKAAANAALPQIALKTIRDSAKKRLGTQLSIDYGKKVAGKFMVKKARNEMLKQFGSLGMKSMAAAVTDITQVKSMRGMGQAMRDQTFASRMNMQSKLASRPTRGPMDPPGRAEKTRTLERQQERGVMGAKGRGWW